MEQAGFLIKTFTMSVDLIEDRIRFDAVDTTGDFQAIWFTRRLANTCLPHLAAHAEQHVSDNIPRELALVMNQEKLRIEREVSPTPPVVVSPDLQPWLCRTVHLATRNKDLLLTMCDDRGSQASIVLNEEAVRAVLDIFLTSYKALEWSDEAFPQWVRGAAAPPARERGSLN